MRRIEPDSAYRRLEQNRARIKQVPCPDCGAPAAVSCKRPNGLSASTLHQARRHAAAVAGVYVP